LPPFKKKNLGSSRGKTNGFPFFGRVLCGLRNILLVKAPSKLEMVQGYTFLGFVGENKKIPTTERYSQDTFYGDAT
jgi:hypothetical protein